MIAIPSEFESSLRSQLKVNSNEKKADVFIHWAFSSYKAPFFLFRKAILVLLSMPTKTPTSASCLKSFKLSPKLEGSGCFQVQSSKGRPQIGRPQQNAIQGSKSGTSLSRRFLFQKWLSYPQLEKTRKKPTDEQATSKYRSIREF